ncbi:MAG: hypothetical protein AAFX80_16575 [Cyanobacteria bacterium J06639_18]
MKLKLSLQAEIEAYLTQRAYRSTCKNIQPIIKQLESKEEKV